MNCISDLYGVGFYLRDNCDLSLLKLWQQPELGEHPLEAAPLSLLNDIFISMPVPLVISILSLFLFLLFPLLYPILTPLLVALLSFLLCDDPFLSEVIWLVFLDALWKLLLLYLLLDLFWSSLNTLDFLLCMIDYFIFE